MRNHNDMISQRLSLSAHSANKQQTVYYLESKKKEEKIEEYIYTARIAIKSQTA